MTQESRIPRLPLEGLLDPTYRCNNACRHCWVGPAEAAQAAGELAFDEVRRIAGEARAMGCRRWTISGGEPLLRPDFADIFDYLTRKCISYSLNTNGTLITPTIARLLAREGVKMVSLYGATAAVHDHITRRAGSFEAALQGMAYLREAGAAFYVQLVPLRDNYQQWPAMVALAERLSPQWRIGAAWLYLSACRSEAHNREIAGQRLDPRDAVALDPPPMGEKSVSAPGLSPDNRLFATCLPAQRRFHVDPYGMMAFCQYIKAPGLRYDLRRGTFCEGWEGFIPSLVDRVCGGQEYLEHCGSCAERGHCRWCGAYAYLEHGRHAAPVAYLCAMAREAGRFTEAWQREHRRYYRVAGVTLQVDADLPMSDGTFAAGVERFRVEGPGEDVVWLRHHFELPQAGALGLGPEVYRRPPWTIYGRGRVSVYVNIPSPPGDHTCQVLLFDEGCRVAQIYNDEERAQTFRKGGLNSLALLPTDQILLARLLADRQACILHAAGMILDGQGLLFVGHSEAGKSTMVTMLRERGTILCDDRIVVRRWPQGYRMHGTWSHGDVPDVSPAEAPLRAILFLEQAGGNCLLPIEKRQDVAARLLLHVIKPLVTRDWWEKTMALVDDLSAAVPAYRLQFDKSGRVIDALQPLLQSGGQ